MKPSALWHEDEGVTPEGKSWTGARYSREGDFWLKIRKTILRVPELSNVLIKKIISKSLMRNRE